MLCFFQAEDGIRDYKVTGVQTCALPISLASWQDWMIFTIFFAVTNIASHKMVKIIQSCQEAKVQYRFLSALHDSTIPNSFNSSLVETNIADIFKTQNVEIDRRSIRRLLEGKRVLVTGASGALGVELCSRILGFSPQSLIIIERYESYLTALILRLQHSFPDATIIPILCSPAGIDNIDEVF